MYCMSNQKKGLTITIHWLQFVVLFTRLMNVLNKIADTIICTHFCNVLSLLPSIKLIPCLVSSSIKQLDVITSFFNSSKYVSSSSGPEQIS